MTKTNTTKKDNKKDNKNKATKNMRGLDNTEQTKHQGDYVCTSNLESRCRLSPSKPYRNIYCKEPKSIASKIVMYSTCLS